MVGVLLDAAVLEILAVGTAETVAMGLAESDHEMEEERDALQERVGEATEEGEVLPVGRVEGALLELGLVEGARLELGGGVAAGLLEVVTPGVPAGELVGPGGLTFEQVHKLALLGKFTTLFQSQH